MVSSSVRRFIISSATLTTHLHKKPPTTAVFPPLASRFFSAAATSITKDNQEKKPQHDGNSKPPPVITGPPEAFKYEHPFQIQGSKDAVEVDDTKDGTLVRLALPGVGEDGYKVWVEHHTVFFHAKADVDFKSDQPKVYGGSLEFQPDFNKAEGVKAQVKNGVLKLFVPNADGVDLVDVTKE